jgi:hypothetical protein
MHHDKLEKLCVQEKNLLFNLIMMFKKSVVFLLKEEDNKNQENKNIINDHDIDDNSKDYKFIKEINSFDLDDDLKKELNNIILQSKTLMRCAINQDQYKNLIDE